MTATVEGPTIGKLDAQEHVRRVRLETPLYVEVAGRVPVSRDPAGERQAISLERARTDTMQQEAAAELELAAWCDHLLATFHDWTPDPEPTAAESELKPNPYEDLTQEALDVEEAERRRRIDAAFAAAVLAPVGTVDAVTAAEPGFTPRVVRRRWRGYWQDTARGWAHRVRRWVGRWRDMARGWARRLRTDESGEITTRTLGEIGAACALGALAGLVVAWPAVAAAVAGGAVLFGAGLAVGAQRLGGRS